MRGGPTFGSNSGLDGNATFLPTTTIKSRNRPCWCLLISAVHSALCLGGGTSDYFWNSDGDLSVDRFRLLHTTATPGRRSTTFPVRAAIRTTLPVLCSAPLFR